MTTVMKQVRCSVSNLKINEIQWMDHLISRDHLQLCKNDESETATEFFESFYEHILKIEKYNLKINKTLDFWQSSFATKLPKEIFHILCKDSINNSELEASLTSDLLDFIQNSTHDIGETYFRSLDKITFCKICSIDTNKTLLYDHFIQKNAKILKNIFYGNV